MNCWLAFDATTCIKKGEDQLRRTTRDLRTRVAQCTEFHGGIFENLFELRQFNRLEINFELK